MYSVKKVHSRSAAVNIPGTLFVTHLHVSLLNFIFFLLFFFSFSFFFSIVKEGNLNLYLDLNLKRIILDLLFIKSKI